MSSRSQLARFTLVIGLCACGQAVAQAPAGPRPPEFTSPEVLADSKVAFRLHAPKAQVVKVVGGDMPGNDRGQELKKGENDVWEVTVGPLPAGAFRYRFDVDGIAVNDPRNPSISESNANSWSLVYVPGSKISDDGTAPHGAVAAVHYHSGTLNRTRRMHVYTPPGYEKSSDRYPVFYLLHGASDSDDSWSSVGRAGFILDNLIAAGKARPMIVVMPAGHTERRMPGRSDPAAARRAMQGFLDDFTNDIRPYIEAHYRVLDGSANRAIAGLSMGGSQTLNIAFGHLADYGYIGVFSSGVFGIAGGFRGEPPSTEWEDQRKSILDDAELKKGLRLFWIGCGKDDFVVKTSDATIKMLKDHHFNVEARTTEGGHTWMNWRDYLSEFAPLLFVEK